VKPAATALTAVSALAASAVAGAARPPVALIASPSHVGLAGSARASVAVTNSGSEAVVVDVARAGFALDLRGRPRAVSRRSSWLTVGPPRIALASGASETLAVSARVPPHAQPGDHQELVLLTTRPSASRGLPVRLRLGVVVVVRAPGRVVHRVDVLRVRGRVSGLRGRLELLLANRGNVTETVGGACTSVTLHRGTRLIARLRTPRREILPRARALVDVRYAGRARGRVNVRVVLLRPCGGLRARTLVVRL
jgi:hypothetical protein